LDADEIIQVHEVECQEALQMIRRGVIQDAKSIAGLFLAFDWLKEK
jgi:ADP-ribose pyrophosphatase